MYATIKAGADRADAEKMAYGAPEGAQGLTAYSYELLGDDGEGSRNTKRGIAALGLLGLGAGGFLLRRRLV
jgi:putative membrane protein